MESKPQLKDCKWFEFADEPTIYTVETDTKISFFKDKKEATKVSKEPDDGLSEFNMTNKSFEFIGFKPLYYVMKDRAFLVLDEPDAYKKMLNQFEEGEYVVTEGDFTDVDEDATFQYRLSTAKNYSTGEPAKILRELRKLTADQKILMTYIGLEEIPDRSGNVHLFSINGENMKLNPEELKELKDYFDASSHPMPGKSVLRKLEEAFGLLQLA